ncbi:MAG: hypothetical protein V3S01_09335 [Dehalococcoidia bacterium]
MKHLIALLIAFLLPGAALAGPAQSTYRGQDTWEWLDPDCTDTNDTPAATTAVDLTTLTTWDTLAEAVNPWLNRNDAVQSSGSADGFCDGEPWKIAGDITTTTEHQYFYVGPIQLPAEGVYLYTQSDAMQDGWAVSMELLSEWGDAIPFWTTGNTRERFRPRTSYLGPRGDDPVPVPEGDIYIRLVLHGTGLGSYHAQFRGIKQ